MIVNENPHQHTDSKGLLRKMKQVTRKNDLPAVLEVFANPLIVKVFYNLIENAMQYGGNISTIRFTVEERDRDQMIVCEDDDVGVPASGCKKDTLPKELYPILYYYTINVRCSNPFSRREFFDPGGLI